jgi:trehalose 6-phosphate phosphatase
MYNFTAFILNLDDNQIQRKVPSTPLLNALKHYSEIQQKLKNKQPVLFLDYDGTLTPIVARPEKALLSAGMRNVLRKLASLYTVAIISGRDMADVKKHVDLDNLVYAGSHGFDITGPGGMRMQYEGGVKTLPSLDSAEEMIRKQLDFIDGIQIERKKFAIGVHYRNVDQKDIGTIKQTVDKILKNYNDLQKSEGKKIIEFQPKIEWHKGKAVLWLLKQLDIKLSDVLPIYIGDDLTDENAFRAISKEGIGILVGKHGKETAAKYQLNNVKEVQQFLNNLKKG